LLRDNNGTRPKSKKIGAPTSAELLATESGKPVTGILFYSLLKLLVGLAVAARRAWVLTMINANTRHPTPASSKTHQEMFTR